MDEEQLLNATDDAVDNKDLTPNEGIDTVRDSLTLSLDDKTFIRRAKKWIKDTNDHNENELNLSSRRKENEKYRWGNAHKGEKLKEHESDFEDNLIGEAEDFLTPMAFSKMPDITVTPGTDSPEAEKSAEDLSKAINTDLQSRERKMVVRMAFSQHPINFIGAIKPFWNPEKGPDGDYDFTWVDAKNLVIDHKAKMANADYCRYIAELCEDPVKDILIKFPKLNKQDLFDELRDTGKFTDDNNEETTAGMETIIKYWEIHFTDYEDKGNGEYQKLECVGWFYNNLVFDKTKTPNWDWKGESKPFSYKEPVSEDQIKQEMLTNQPIDGFNMQTVFRNYFQSPKKPYILIGYHQDGTNPLDKTSRIEQAIKLQKNYDKRGRQITELIDNARVKHIFSKDSGLTLEDLEEFDLSDPTQDLLIKGKVNEVHASFQGELPSPALIQDKNESRQRLFEKYGLPGSVRGEIQSNVATTNQISREGAFTKADDVVDVTINWTAEQMAGWIMQFIKLRYSEDHFIRVLGQDGKILSQRLHRDMIQDGMEAMVSASGSDKLKAEQRAMDMAKMKMIDPYRFYKDIGASDPKGRTEDLLMFMMQPNMYLEKIKGNTTVSDVAGALNGTSPNGEGAGGGSPQALMDIAQIQQGVIPPVPSVVDSNYVQTMNNFMDTQAKQVVQQYSQKDPQFGQKLAQFMEQVVAIAQQMSNQGGQPQGGATPANQFGSGGSQSPVGPVANGQPNPNNTQRVSIQPPKVG